MGLKMAKASQDERDRAIRFANELHDKLYRENTPNEDLGKWVRENAPPLLRVTFGYSVLVDNCCDPNETTLQWKPEWLAAMADKERLDWMEQMRSECEGLILTRCFIPGDATLRTNIDAQMPKGTTLPNNA